MCEFCMIKEEETVRHFKSRETMGIYLSGHNRDGVEFCYCARVRAQLAASRQLPIVDSSSPPFSYCD